MFGIGKDKKKQDVELDDAPAGGASGNGVLSALKRFRSKKEPEQDDFSFDTRISGRASFDTEVASIAEKIDADRNDFYDDDDYGLSDDSMESLNGSNSQYNGKKPAMSRTRVMQFHKPAFSAHNPDTYKDPDFSASTQPPKMKLHSGSEGVMENPSAPEGFVTAPKEKHVDPIDDDSFAAAIRSQMPKQPDPEPQITEESPKKRPPTDFYARISKVAQDSEEVEQPEPVRQDGFKRPARKPKAEPAQQTGGGLSNLRKSSAYRAFGESRSQQNQLNDQQQDTWNAPPARKNATVRAPLHMAPEPETVGAATAPMFEPDFDTAPPMLDPFGGPPTHGFADDVADFENMEPYSEPEPEMDDFSDEDAEIFAKPDIDEEALLVRIYDLVQEELQHAWGENITINVRKIVREEIQRAMAEKRDGR